MLPIAGNPSITAADFMCKETQRKQDSKNALTFLAGDSYIFRYNENGHITKPWADPAKPGPGRVYIYGTDSPREDERFLDIHGVWDRSDVISNRGTLLGDFNFDDGKCYQYSTDSEIQKKRAALYGHGNQPVEGLNLWCENMVNLSMIQFKSTYTMYWVWDWPDDDGKPQIYTSCIDLAYRE